MARVDKTAKTQTEEVSESVASDTLPVAQPGSKTEAIARIVDMLGSLTPEDALNAYDLMVQGIGHEAQQDFSKQNAASVVAKGAMKEDVAALFGSEEGLTEEFKTKASVLFEAAVSTRVKLEVGEIVEAFKKANENRMEQFCDNLLEQIDGYISHACDTWVEKNEVAVESSLRTEITEEFLSDLAAVYEKHNINLPEDSVDVVEELVARIDDLEERYNVSVNDNLSLIESLRHYRKEEIFAEACEDLTVIDSEKLRTLAEDVDFDEETYASKLNILKESIVTKTGKQCSTGIVSDEETSLNEDIDNGTPAAEQDDSEMSQYTAALSRLYVKK